MVHAAVDRRSNFDPATDELFEAYVSGKHVLQQARKTIDLRSGNGWALFKTDLVDNCATYRFDPDPSVAFALILSPKS